MRVSKSLIEQLSRLHNSVWYVCACVYDSHDDPCTHPTPVFSTQPLAAWHNDGPRQETTVHHHIAFARGWIGRACAFGPERREATQLPAPSPPVLPPGFDTRALNVTVLVAMPRRKDVQPVPGSILHPSDRSGLLYDEGQLELGVTRLLYEQAAQEEYERTP